MASEKSKSGPNRLSGKAADAVVMMAMALVTLALCIGLILQSGLGVWLSATVSVSFYVGLLTLHTIMRRAGQMDELRAEVERLRGEIARVQSRPTADAGMAGETPADARALGATAARATAPQVASYPAAPVKVGSASSAASAPPAASTKPMTDAPLRSTLEAGVPLGAEAVSPPLQGAGDRRHAQAAASLSRPAAADEPRGPHAMSPERKGAEADVASAPTSDFAARMNRAIRAPGSAPPPPPVAPAQAARQPFSAIKSSQPMRPPSAVAPPQPPAAATTPPPVVSEYSERPVMPAGFAGTAANSPREADVEMIQGLIRKLAAEVDSADAEKLGTSTTDAEKALAIEASVGALKRAAETMKSPAASHGPAAAGEDDVDTQPLGFRRRRSEAAPTVPTVAEAAPAIARPATPPPAEEPEFDVEKLMQRAQSIAAMTSPPPPLPAVGLDMAETHTEDRGGPDNVAESREVEVHYAAEPEAAPQLDEAMAAAQPDVARRGDAREIDERLGRIAAALDAGRVEVLLEPILDLARQQAQHYEVSVCLRDVDGSEIAGGSNDDGMPSALPLLDSVRLSRTAQVARLLEERRKSGAVFSSFSGHSLDSDEFLTTFADTVEAQAGLADQLVLTFAQADVRAFRAPQWAMVEEMRELGFRFALRAVTHLDMDFEPLARAGFAFVKLDAEVFLEGLPAPGALVPAADICRQLGEYGLAVVVEHIDDEAKRQKVAGAGVQLGQGQLFGGPRLVKASVLAAIGRPAAA